MATNSYMTFLMYKASGTTTYTKLVDIKDYPDIGGSPEVLDTTTLSNRNRTNILGIQETESMEFTCNYDKDDYETIKALVGTVQHLAVWFGGTESGATLTPSGDEGKWSFDGYIDVHPTGKGVNEVREMVVTIAPSSDIDFA